MTHMEPHCYEFILEISIPDEIKKKIIITHAENKRKPETLTPFIHKIKEEEAIKNAKTISTIPKILQKVLFIFFQLFY